MEETFARLNTLGPLFVMVILFYFFLYRPHKKQQTRHNDMISRLKKGTHVVTIGGIYGDVVEVKERSVIIRIAPKVEIEVATAAISGDFTVPGDGPEASAPAETAENKETSQEDAAK